MELLDWLWVPFLAPKHFSHQQKGMARECVYWTIYSTAWRPQEKNVPILGMVSLVDSTKQLCFGIQAFWQARLLTDRKIILKNVFLKFCNTKTRKFISMYLVSSSENQSLPKRRFHVSSWNQMAAGILLINK